MQATYGTANFSQWQSVRKQFYSSVQYPEAGANQLNLFGYAVTGAVGQNQQYTNMQKAGSFGPQFFLLKSIQCYWYTSTAQNLLSAPLAGGVVTDVDNPSADFIAGFFQAGYFELDVGAKPYVVAPMPFMYLPPADGATTEVAAFGASGTTAGTVFTGFDTLLAYADLNRNQNNRYLVDPNILMEAEQQFQCVISFPSGLIPLIATNIFTTNVYVGVILDGILFRPVQ